MNLKFAYAVLRWNQDRQVDVTNVKRLTVEILHTLVGKRATDLEVAP